jgi:hypothetical protein
METKDDKDYFVRLWNNNYRMNNDGCCTPIYAIIIISILVLFCSCATKTVVEYRDRDVNHYITNTVHDTLIDKSTDSVYFEVKVKGDTVFATKYKEKIRWRDRIVEKHDTCFRDSVVTITKETTKEIVKIPKIFWCSFAFSIICIIFATTKLIRWLKVR